MRNKKTFGPKPDNTPHIPAVKVLLMQAGLTAQCGADHVTDCFDYSDKSTFLRKNIDTRMKLKSNVTSLTEKTSKMTHGDTYRGRDQVRAADVLFPKHSLNAVVLEKIREEQYKRAPVGKPVPKAGLPSSLPSDFCFGISSERGIDVAELIYADKSLKCQQRVDESGKKYQRSVPVMSRVRLYFDGHRVAEVVKWEANPTSLIERRLESFRERTRKQLGKVHDPIKDTMSHLPSTHTLFECS